MSSINSESKKSDIMKEIMKLKLKLPKNITKAEAFEIYKLNRTSKFIGVKYLRQKAEELGIKTTDKTNKKVKKSNLFTKIFNKLRKNKKLGKKALKEIKPLDKKIEAKIKKDQFILGFDDDVDFRPKIEEDKLKKLRTDIFKLIREEITELTINIEDKPLIEVLKAIKQMTGGSNMIMRAGDVFYTLNITTYERLIKNIDSVRIRAEAFTTSDGKLAQELVRLGEITIARNSNNFTKSGALKIRSSGAFFTYTHKTDLDLARYGIFKEVNSENYHINCIIRALENGGLEEIKLNFLKAEMRNRSITMARLKTVSENLKIYIRVTNLYNNKDKKRVTTYGDKNSKQFNIGLLNDHYFINEETKYSAYSINNYEDVKDKEEWWDIYDITEDQIVRRKNKKLDSFDLIKLLIDNKDKLLKAIDMSNPELYKTQFYNKFKNISSLEYLEHNVQEVKVRKPYNNKSKLLWFDFETYQLKTEEGKMKHIPYLCCISDEKDNIKTYYGINCGSKMLEDLTEDSTLIAHNAGYDFRFIIKELFRISLIEKGNSLMNCNAMYTNKKTKKTIKITVKDSYKLLSMPLRAFPKFLSMTNIKKEVMPYELYNEDTIRKQYMNIDEVLKMKNENGTRMIMGKDREQFLENIKRWELERVEGYFDIIEYSSKYCEIDVKLLKKGYLQFKKWMKEITNINIDTMISSASLADTFFKAKGCYKEVYELSGVVREFISRCVVGGRTMTNRNRMYHCKETLADYDGVSLYPSAIERLGGFLKGKPKIIKNKSYDNIKNYDGYFIEIVFNRNARRKRHFPLLSIVTDKGVRSFTNEFKDHHLFIDKITLEDVMKFHDMKPEDFEIIRGYYFDEGVNKKSKKIIRFLFNERLKKKKEENPIQEIYKLIMNSSYGKTVMKPIETDLVIISGKAELDKYIQFNYNSILEYVRVDDSNKYKVKIIKPIDEHFSRPQVGVNILSMSKRIMNEVMCLAEDEGIFIYYQDTDSMHMPLDDVPKLEKAFKKKYNRVLTGKGLGQFHIDFNMYDKDGEKIKGVANIRSVESYFLGKKCYIDHLIGEKDGVTIEDYHIRMKGITGNSIAYKAHHLNINELELYKKLYNHEKVDFNLLLGLNGHGDIVSNCSFKYNKDMSIESNINFMREISF